MGCLDLCVNAHPLSSILMSSACAYLFFLWGPCKISLIITSWMGLKILEEIFHLSSELFNMFGYMRDNLELKDKD